MSNNKDYIPAKDADLGPWAHNLVDFAKANAARLGIPSLETSVLESYLNNWDTDYQKAAAANHTAADIVQKNATRGMLKTGIRAFVNQYVRGNPAVTDTDLAGMGLPIADTSHTPVTPPEVWPELQIDTGTSLHLFVHYRDPLHPRGGKPEHVAGMELRWAMLDSPPEHVSELVNSSFDTKSPLDLSFDLNDRGKRVFMMGRWEIHREGMKGPFSPIIDAIIP
jgi:hypothetical protein